MTFAQTTILAASRGVATQLTVLVHRVHDPVDARIATNCLVVRINQDHFEELVRGILSDPVRVQHAKVTGDLAADTLLSDTTETALELELGHTFRDGLTVANT